MLVKLLTILGVALALWGWARRLFALGEAPPPGVSGAADMVRCSRCGAWRAPQARCACATPPTP